MSAGEVQSSRTAKRYVKAARRANHAQLVGKARGMLPNFCAESQKGFDDHGIDWIMRAGALTKPGYPDSAL
jgi:hypothetical protein